MYEWIVTNLRWRRYLAILQTQLRMEKILKEGKVGFAIDAITND